MSWSFYLVAVAAVLLVLGPAGHANAQPVRVIALGGDITEIVHRLGEQNRPDGLYGIGAGRCLCPGL